MFVRYQLIAVCVLVAVALTLTGCSGGSSQASPTSTTPTSRVTPAPGTSPVSQSASPSPARTGPLTTGPNVRPGEKPPVLGPAASKRSALGAIFFARYYFLAFDWSYATNDPVLLEQLTLPSCKACASAIVGLKRLMDHHGVLRGGRLHVGDVAIDQRKFNVPADYALDVTSTESAATVTFPSARPSIVATAQTGYRSVVLLRWVADRWRVAELFKA